MAAQVPFFATEIDDANLRAHISSLGVWIVPAHVDRLEEPLESPGSSVFCYIAVQPPSELRTTTHARPKFNSALSSLIEFTRSRREGRFLIAGRVWCAIDVPRLAVLRPAFAAIQQWIHQNWAPHGLFWLGPGAQKELQEGRIELAPVSPATEYHILKINKA